MTTQLFSTLAEYRLIIMTSLLVLLVVFNTRKSGRNKFICCLTTLLALSILYELITDKPVTSIPRQINLYFNKAAPTKTQNVHYYSLPKELQETK